MEDLINKLTLLKEESETVIKGSLTNPGNYHYHTGKVHAYNKAIQLLKELDKQTPYETSNGSKTRAKSSHTG